MRYLTYLTIYLAGSLLSSCCYKCVTYPKEQHCPGLIKPLPKPDIPSDVAHTGIKDDPEVILLEDIFK